MHTCSCKNNRTNFKTILLVTRARAQLTSLEPTVAPFLIFFPFSVPTPLSLSFLFFFFPPLSGSQVAYLHARRDRLNSIELSQPSLAMAGLGSICRNFDNLARVTTSGEAGGWLRICRSPCLSFLFRCGADEGEEDGINHSSFPSFFFSQFRVLTHPTLIPCFLFLSNPLHHHPKEISPPPRPSPVLINPTSPDYGE